MAQIFIYGSRCAPQGSGRGCSRAWLFDSQLPKHTPPYGSSLMRDPGPREGRCAVVLAVGGQGKIGVKSAWLSKVAVRLGGVWCGSARVSREEGTAYWRGGSSVEKIDNHTEDGSRPVAHGRSPRPVEDERPTRRQHREDGRLAASEQARELEVEAGGEVAPAAQFGARGAPAVLKGPDLS